MSTEKPEKALPRWFRFRENHAASHGTWEYVESSEELMREKADAVASSYWWTDKFRGLEWEAIDFPPTEWLAAEVARLKQAVWRANQMLVEYEQLLAWARQQEKGT